MFVVRQNQIVVPRRKWSRDFTYQREQKQIDRVAHSAVARGCENRRRSITSEGFIAEIDQHGVMLVIKPLAEDPVAPVWWPS